MSIAKDVKLGKNVIITNKELVNLYGCEIGDETKIGPFTEIQNGVKIGAKCKISSHTFICSGVTFEDNVFVGHGVMFTNDKYPRSVNAKGEMQTPYDWQKVENNIIVKKGASIGSNATILCGLTIGENSIIGAGSVVTRNVAPNSVVAGNPAKLLRKL